MKTIQELTHEQLRSHRHSLIEITESIIERIETSKLDQEQINDFIEELRPIRLEVHAIDERLRGANPDPSTT